MVKEDLTSVDGHAIQYIDDASQKYTLEIYIMLLTQLNLI